jgi:putative SOS response-associated peptidase YedK
MCGRYRQARDPREVAEFFDTVNPFPNTPPRWNIAPTQAALVVRRHPETGARHLDALRWGLVPHWAKDLSVGARLINARAEGVAGRPSFRAAFAKRRCLVPADGFYEWRKGDGPKAPKQPYTVALRDGSPMALAGLWEGWRGPGGEVVRTFTIITTDANEKLRALHDRMPAILPGDTWAAWLGEEPTEPHDLLALLISYPSADLAAWPVPRRVGRVAEDDPGLVERDGIALAVAGLDEMPPSAQAGQRSLGGPARSWWLTFGGRPAGCVEAPTEADAGAIAVEATGHSPTSVRPLPYPADPRINTYDDPTTGVSPSFCLHPAECAGHTACPRRPSCVD